MDLTSLLHHSISMHEAEEIMTCSDFDQELAQRRFFTRLKHYINRNAFCHHYVERAYKYRLVKALVFETPHKHLCCLPVFEKRRVCYPLSCQESLFAGFPFWWMRAFRIYLLQQVHFIARGCFWEWKRSLSHLKLIMSFQSS